MEGSLRSSSLELEMEISEILGVAGACGCEGGDTVVASGME